MKDFMERLKAGFNFVFSSYKRTAAVLFFAGPVLSIPITISLLGQQQDIRQRAAEGAPCVITGSGSFTDTGAGGISTDGPGGGSTWVDSPQQGTCAAGETCVPNADSGGGSTGVIAGTCHAGTAPSSTPTPTPTPTTPPTGCGSIDSGGGASGGISGGDSTSSGIDGQPGACPTGSPSSTPTPTPAPTCTPRPGGMDGFLSPDGTIGTPGVIAPPNGGSYCPNQAPTTSTSSNISPVPIVTNGTASEYKITITSTDPQGGNTIFRQYASVNEPNTGGAQRRGLVGWSAVGFEKYWGSVLKAGTVALRCISGGGAVAIYGGAVFGSEYMSVRWCTTSSSGNTRTTEMYVSFNPNFTAPASNTLYGFTEDAGGLYDNFKSLQTFNLATAPTNTPTATPIINPASDEGLDIALKITGIGEGAAALNLNPKPLHPTRTFTMNFKSAQGQDFASTGTLTYDADTGQFKGTIPIPQGLVGNHTVKIRQSGNSANMLWRNLGIAFNPSQTPEIPVVMPILGDADQNNTLNINDYTAFITCKNHYDPSNPQSGTPPTQCVEKEKYDFNDDGKIDELDLNLLLSAFRSRDGD